MVTEPVRTLPTEPTDREIVKSHQLLSFINIGQRGRITFITTVINTHIGFNSCSQDLALLYPTLISFIYFRFSYEEAKNVEKEENPTGNKIHGKPKFKKRGREKNP